MPYAARGPRVLRGHVSQAATVLGGAVALFPRVSPALALLSGIAVALVFGNPWPTKTRTVAHRLLTTSVIGLGAGMNLVVVARTGWHGVTYTAIGIAFALVSGVFLGRVFGVSKDTSLLVTVGTAICGGSAIAAVAPSLRAKDADVSLSLVTIFLLNGVALVLFPWIGRRLHLEQDTFGLWCALAIHDTSSVVGAASSYGPRALEIATAAKLARALWIVPVTFSIAALRSRSPADTEKATPPRPKPPWFVAGFLAAAAIVTFVPALQGVGRFVTAIAHRLLALSLFVIGLGMSREALRALGPRPLAQALTLWGILATATLTALRYGWIR